MHSFKRIIVAGLLSAPLAAYALGPNSVDLYYVPVADLDIEDASFDDGDGYGIRAQFDVAPNVFLSGEYQQNEYDNLEGSIIDGSLDWLRLGAGLRFDNTPFYGRVEYVDAQFELKANGVSDDTDDSGFGVHVGAAAPVSDVLHLRGEVGYLDVGDFGDGFELQFGALFALGESVGLFADYRYTQLEDGGDEADLGDFLTGVRFSF
ncbi:MAG: outer membrane beta-barrel protein [Nevskiales bacterium]|nr:outer membrane beta-barrel protein [Nevskiales bacterium]